jgi:hypothetical protein
MERSKYNHNDLTGMDADIEISLKEHGFAWIETETEFLFYYGIKTELNECGEHDFTRFDFCSIDKEIDIKEEFDWVDFEAVNDFVGGGFFENPLEFQINDLISYYGYENVFGTSYYEGLTYNEIIKEN